MVAVRPLHRDFEHDVLTLAPNHDGRGVQRLFRAVEITDKRLEPAIEMQSHSLRLDAAQIAQHQRHAAVQKGELTQPVL